MLLLVSGSRSGAGKTAVACALISALPEMRWTAIKATPHEHEAVGIWEETDHTSEKDTARFLLAGAQRAFLINSYTGSDAEEFVRETEGEVLVESNQLSLAGWAERSLRLMVIAKGEWKLSARACAERADALVLTQDATIADMPAYLNDRRIFTLASGIWASPALIEFVRSALHV